MYTCMIMMSISTDQTYNTSTIDRQKINNIYFDLTVKVTSTQVVEMPVTNNSSIQTYIVPSPE